MVRTVAIGHQNFETIRENVFFILIKPPLYAIGGMWDFLYRYYGKKVIILLDEYDTPVQEAYVHGYWDEMASYTRSMFNAAFKTNACLERAIMTGILGKHQCKQSDWNAFAMVLC